MQTPRIALSTAPRASRGQVIIMFALFLTGMMGLLGLAIDLGFAFSAKRTVQNAADAGAMAGARAVAKWTILNGYSASGDVSGIVNNVNNRMSGSTHTLVSCDYVNDADSSVAPCASVVPPTATGVRVVVSEVVNTFFIQVVPGAPNTVTVEATATAHVQALARAPSDGPFIVCGINTKLEVGSGNVPLSILLDNSTFNPLAFGQTFRIHGPQIEDCGSAGESFKGLAEQNGNAGNDVNQYWDGDTGDSAGPTRVQVDGVEGCAANTPDPYNCVVILPIATNNPAPIGQGSSGRTFYVVKYAAFRVSRCGANCHAGTLLEDYIVAPPAGTGVWNGSNGWAAGTNGIVSVRLTD